MEWVLIHLNDIIGRTDVEAETPILWPPDAKSSLEKTLMLGKIESRRKRGWQRMRWFDGITDSMDMNLSKFREWAMDREAWPTAVNGVPKSWTRLSNWTELTLRTVMWPHLVSVSSSGKWGQYLPGSLLQRLKVISIRAQHSAWCTDLTHQELREVMCMHTNYWAE